ncbi:TIM barrel protein [Sulfitobacter sp. D35]|uniref:TIM barrel protein n=1 Tax=Sulfitobacter sp. D35 TaxID=3083252 RepID=UPI00296FCA2B|nr:TIM barrel protein [Sulfitobacter sp. D35]MDW4500025.1 TIM barrel protein [Sulfitobacter sp. D35]
MIRPNRPRYAARLNAFKTLVTGRATSSDMIAQAGRVGGLDAADLNYPDHFDETSPKELSRRLGDAGLALNGLAMRYYTDPGFKLGAFTHPDRDVRRAAIDLTKRGIDAGQEMGGRLMTLWMGQDGFDYAFQMDYARAWDDTVAAITEVCDHAPEVDIAIEYKPNEPRAYALMPDIGTTLLACREVARPNLGVTLDFAHVLYADEMPAHSAALIARHSRLLGLHLNDGYGKRDDGLMAGSVHPVQTVELLVEMLRQGYDGVIYFDTFPDHGGLDPIAEAGTNVALIKRLRAVAESLADDADLAAAIARQDAAASTRIVAAALYGVT